jgi:hypothetical protein
MRAGTPDIAHPKGAKVVGLHGQRMGLVHSIGLVLE